SLLSILFYFNHTQTSDIYTLSLHDALPIYKVYEQVVNVAMLPGIVQASYAMPDAHWGYGFPIGGVAAFDAERGGVVSATRTPNRSEEHTSELQSLTNLVCRLLLEKKK